MILRNQICLFVFSSLIGWNCLAQPDWDVNPGEYQYSMTVIAALSADEVDLEGSQHTLAAFVDGEVRGVASPNVYVASIDRNVAFLTVFSNNITGDQVTFQFYDGDHAISYQGIKVLTFTDGAQNGINTEPIEIENLQLRFEPETLEDVIVFSDSRTLSLSTNLDEEPQLLLEVISGPAEVMRQASTNTFDVDIADVAGEVLLRGTVPDGSFYSGVTKEISFNVLKTDQTITFDAIANKTFGYAPFTISASSSSNLPVSFEVVEGSITITDNEVTITGAGTATIQAIQAGDETFNPAEEVTQTFEIAKATPVIAFDPSTIENKESTAEDFTLIVNADAGIPEVTISGVATLSNARNPYTISLTGETGTVTITATLTSTANYLSATETITFNVTNPAKSDQTITFDAIANKTLGDTPFTLSASASSNLPVSYEVVEGAISVTDNEVTIAGAGTAAIKAIQSGDDTFNPAEEVIQTFEIAKATPVIKFDPSTIENKETTAEDFTLIVNADAGTPEVTISGVATLRGSENPYTVSLTGQTGTVTITATLVETTNYLSETEIITFNVTSLAKTDQTITFDAIPNKTFGDASFTLSAIASSNLSVSYEVLEGSITITDNEVTITGAGTATIKATQAGDDNFNPAEEVIQTFEIAKADQTIFFELVGEVQIGQGNIQLVATSSSNLPVLFTSSDVKKASILADVLEPLAEGTVTITATQSGNNNYQATSVTRQLTVKEVLSVERILDLKLYPMPAQDYIIVEGFGQNIDYQIIDLSGKEIQLGAADGNRIDMTKVESGGYLILIGNTPKAFKLIKE